MSISARVCFVWMALSLTPLGSATAGFTLENASLTEYTEYHPTLTLALHHGRQALIEPGEMSFTPKLWFGSATPNSSEYDAGLGFAFEGSINSRTGFGVAIGSYNGSGLSTGIAGSVRRTTKPTARVTTALQGVLSYQWDPKPRDTAVRVPGVLDELNGVFRLSHASWLNAFVHAVADVEFGPLHPVAELGLLVSRSSIRGAEQDGPAFDDFGSEVTYEETMVRITGGAGLALDLGVLDAFMGGAGYNGGYIFALSVSITGD